MLDIVGNHRLISNEYVKLAANWGKKQLLKGRRPNILIWFNKENTEDKGYYGLMENECYNEYTIHLNPFIRRDTLIRTLFHELKHVDQYLRCTMTFDNDARIWMGKRYRDDIVWRNAPWEIDARAVEKPLYEQWTQETKHLKKCQIYHGLTVDI